MPEVAAVFDSSAIIALFRAEPGAAKAASFLSGGAVSSVNLAELRSKISDWAVPEMRLREFIRALDLSVIPFAEELAYVAGRLREATRPFGFSLGDRACIATAMGYRVPAVSADRSWTRAALDVEIVLIR
ncbi:MAG: PIN domain-containing protein [Hyphomicrobiales bacterium]